MKGLQVTKQIEEGMFLKNEKGTVVRVKEIFHEMVIFDEEGTEHVLPKDLFNEYVEQEKYKVLNVKKKQQLKEVVESSQSVGSIIEAICNLTEGIVGDRIECDNCDHSWAIAEGGDDLFICHECGHDNTPNN